MKRALSKSLSKDNKRFHGLEVDDEITFNFDDYKDVDYDIETDSEDENKYEEVREKLDKSEEYGKSFIKGREEWTRLISNFIDKHIDKCNLNLLFDWKVIPSSSASNTSIIECLILSSFLNVVGKQKDSLDVDIYKSLIGEVRDDNNNQYKNKCVIKASFVEHIDEKLNYKYIDNSLDVETQIYKHAIKEVIKYTPCILNSYGSYVCDIDSINNLDEVMKGSKITEPDYEDEDDENIYKDVDNKTNSKTINLLILERSSGKSLFDYLDEKNKDKTVLLTILFQLFWTLRVMSRLNVKHNDLHFGNIFVDELKEEITLYFKLPQDAPLKYKDKYVKIKTKYLLRIYDFDRGSTSGYPEIDRNILIENKDCENSGKCNDTFELYDLWNVCTVLSLIDYDNNYDKYKKKVVVENRILQYEDIIEQFDFIKGEIEELSENLKSWGRLYKGKGNRMFVNHLPQLDAPLKAKLNKDVRDTLLNKLYDIIDISEFEIVDKVKKDIIYYYLPDQKEISNYTPKCVYNDYKYMKFKSDSKPPNDINKTKHMTKLKEYIDSGINELIKNTKIDRYILYNNDEKYPLKNKTLEILLKYLEERNPSFLQIKDVDIDFKMCIAGCIILCSPVYHKIMSNHSLNKDTIISLFYKYYTFQNKNLKPYIDDIWKTFDGTLPIEVPQL